MRVRLAVSIAGYALIGGFAGFCSGAFREIQDNQNFLSSRQPRNRAIVGSLGGAVYAVGKSWRTA